MRTLLPAAIALTVALPAHAGWLADAGFDTGLRGGVAFQDAATDLDGVPCAPAVPQSDAVDVSLELTAIASWDLPRPECRFVTEGEVEGLYEGEGRVRPDGVYIAAFSSSSADFMADVGCAVSDPSLGLITGARLRAELTPTLPQCEAYCAASARSTAEGVCGAEPGAADCRLEAEDSAAAECMVTCTEEAYAIVGEAEIGARAIAGMNSHIEGAGWGVARARLQIDHLEDADGETLDH